MKNPFSQNGHSEEEGQFEKLIQEMKLKSQKLNSDNQKGSKIALLLYAIAIGSAIIGYLMSR